MVLMPYQRDRFFTTINSLTAYAKDVLGIPGVLFDDDGGITDATLQQEVFDGL